MLTVICVTIDEDQLEKDEDEYKWEAASIEGADYYRLPRNIDLQNETIKVGYFFFDSSQSCDNFIDGKKYKDIRWSELDVNQLWNGDDGPMTDCYSTSE